MSSALKWTGAGYVSVPLAVWDTSVPMQFARHSVELSLSLSLCKLVCTDSIIRYTYIPDCCTVFYHLPHPLSLSSLFVNLSCISQSQPHECCSDKDRLQDCASAEIQFHSVADSAPVRSGVLRAHKLRTHQNLPA